VKVASVAPANPAAGLPRIQGLYLLHDAATLAPVALLDGVTLTNIRTPAVSALSADHLAVPDATTLVVFGTGPQAWGHVLAMRAVRPITHVHVVGRSAQRAEALVRRIRGLGLTAEAATADAVATADVVCACTSAAEPLFDGRMLPEHAHVVAVGSHEEHAREVDTATFATAQVVVEDRDTALREAGDVIIGLRESGLGVDHLLADLPELVAGAGLDPFRRTLFKSVGMAWQDLALAEVVYESTLDQAP
jgi:ornithine cyclodeaminase/alanine dehydrogenase-like protein (mu-crystallin family)